jgi:uncharacterized membrane protein (Fun14 family)
MSGDGAADVWIAALAPASLQLGLGSLAGAAVGYTLRAGAKAVAVVAGGGFMLVQGLAYNGIVEVDWKKAEREAVRLLDRDQDGKLTGNDVQSIWANLNEVIRWNVPAGSGFSGGLLYGLSGGSFKLLAAGAGAYTAGSSALLQHSPLDLLLAQPDIKRLAEQASAGQLSAQLGGSLEALRKQGGAAVATVAAAGRANPKEANRRRLEALSIDELRAVEYELRNSITTQAQALGLKLEDGPERRRELLALIESSKKIVKAKAHSLG